MGWKAKTGKILGETEIPAICGGQGSKSKCSGTKEMWGFERFPSSERAAEGVGIAQSLLGRRDRWTRLSGCALPSRLGSFS